MGRLGLVGEMKTPRITGASVILRSAIISASLALFAMLLSNDSQAQIHIGAEGGWTGLADRTDDILNVTSFKARFDAGFNAGVRGGYEWGPWRFEEEYSYRQNGARDLVGSNFTLKGVSGDRHTHSIMTNVLY